MDKYVCTRCETTLTEYEYKNYVCLCEGCKSKTRSRKIRDSFIWEGNNNIDNILESRRGG